MEEEMDTQDNEVHLENLVKVLDTLKDTDLQLIEMRFFEQRPFKEIADILDMTESNAKVRTYRILERLKTKLINMA
jgi:RNA polymerase sigma-70 factor (ECF subfamily)